MLPYALVLLQSSGMIWSPPLRGRFPVPVGSELSSLILLFLQQPLSGMLG